MGRACGPDPLEKMAPPEASRQRDRPRERCRLLQPGCRPARRVAGTEGGRHDRSAEPGLLVAETRRRSKHPAASARSPRRSRGIAVGVRSGCDGLGGRRHGPTPSATASGVRNSRMQRGCVRARPTSRIGGWRGAVAPAGRPRGSCNGRAAPAEHPAHRARLRLSSACAVYLPDDRARPTAEDVNGSAALAVPRLQIVPNSQKATRDRTHSLWSGRLRGHCSLRTPSSRAGTSPLLWRRLTET